MPLKEYVYSKNVVNRYHSFECTGFINYDNVKFRCDIPDVLRNKQYGTAKLAKKTLFL